MTKFYKQPGQFLFLVCRHCQRLWKPNLPLKDIKSCWVCRSKHWDKPTPAIIQTDAKPTSKDIQAALKKD